MSIATIKSIAIGLISIPQRPQHHEAMLDTALTSALAAYSVQRPLLMSVQADDEAPVPGTDEQGDYLDCAIPLDTGIAYATMITTVLGEQYKFRLVNIPYPDSIVATVRVYGAPAGKIVVNVWR